MSESKKLKTIAFDLDTKALQEHYTKGDWHNAYNDIGAFLQTYNFARVQGSVYDSKTMLDETDMTRLIDNLCIEISWFPQCVKAYAAMTSQKQLITHCKQKRGY